jgi:hypothetical protein
MECVLPLTASAELRNKVAWHTTLMAAMMCTFLSAPEALPIRKLGIHVPKDRRT